MTAPHSDIWIVGGLNAHRRRLPAQALLSGTQLVAARELASAIAARVVFRRAEGRRTASSLSQSEVSRQIDRGTAHPG